MLKNQDSKGIFHQQQPAIGVFRLDENENERSSNEPPLRRGQTMSNVLKKREKTIEPASVMAKPANSLLSSSSIGNGGIRRYPTFTSRGVSSLTGAGGDSNNHKKLLLPTQKMEKGLSVPRK